MEYFSSSLVFLYLHYSNMDIFSFKVVMKLLQLFCFFFTVVFIKMYH